MQQRRQGRRAGVNVRRASTCGRRQAKTARSDAARRRPYRTMPTTVTHAVTMAALITSGRRSPSATRRKPAAPTHPSTSTSAMRSVCAAVRPSATPPMSFSDRPELRPRRRAALTSSRCCSSSSPEGSWVWRCLSSPATVSRLYRRHHYDILSATCQASAPHGSCIRAQCLSVAARHVVAAVGPSLSLLKAAFSLLTSRQSSSARAQWASTTRMPQVPIPNLYCNILILYVPIYFIYKLCVFRIFLILYCVFICRWQWRNVVGLFTIRGTTTAGCYFDQFGCTVNCVNGVN